MPFTTFTGVVANHTAVVGDDPGTTGAQFKTLLDKGVVDTKAFINAHIAELENATDGASASERLGSGAIVGVAGSTPHAQMASLKSQINNAVLGVIPDNTITDAKLISTGVKAQMAQAASNIPDHSIVRGAGGAKGVQGSDVYISDFGKMGIGTSDPLNILDVKVGTDQHVGIGSSSGMPSIGTFNDAFTDFIPLLITASVVELLLGQIKFPAAQNASADANTLDDYEEGAWTGGITFNGASVGITYISTNGYYTKVGNKVYVSLELNLSNKGSSTGIVSITGLPFAALSLSTVTIGYAALLTFADILLSYIQAGATTMRLGEVTKAGDVTDLTNADFTNATYLILSATYFV